MSHSFFWGAHEGPVADAVTEALTADDLKKARALLRSGEYTKVELAKELQVSRHTLWRALAQEAPL